MGFLDWLLRRREIIEVHDDDLGVLRHRLGDKTWTVSFPLPRLPADTMAEVEMSGGDEGPDERAQNEAMMLQARWLEFLKGPIADELLELELLAAESDKTRRKHDRKSIFREYKLASVRLQALAGGAYLEVGFYPRWSEDHYVVLYFNDWEPAGSSIDS